MGPYVTGVGKHMHMCTPALWKPLSSRQAATEGRGSFSVLRGSPKGSLDGLTSFYRWGIRRVHRTVCLWVQGNGGCGRLKEGRWVFFFFSYSSFPLCVTSIKTQKYGTRTNRHKSAALFTAPLTPARLASCLQGAWEGRSATTVGRGNEAEGKPGQSRETDREERNRPVHNRSEDGRPSSLPKDPRNIAESGEGQRRRGIEAPWE